MNLRELKAEYEAHQTGDDFGDVMNVWFPLANYLHFERGGAPDSWQFSPGIATEVDADDWEILELLGIPEAITLTLFEFGNWLSEKRNDCAKRGVDY